jgi:polyhydroxybutyrate depolymerase
LSHLVACRLADRVAAVATVAGTLDPTLCQPSAPMSAIAIHGTADKLVDYEGGQFPRIVGGRSYVGAADAASFWKAHNHCAITTEPVVYDNVRKTRFSRGDAGTEVVLFTIEGGNHSWPGGRRVSIFGSPPSPDLPATDLIWEFFAAHPKQ